MKQLEIAIFFTNLLVFVFGILDAFLIGVIILDDGK